MKPFACVYIIILLSIKVSSQSIPTTLDNYLKDVYKQHVIPGFSVVVVKDNKVIFSKGYGVEVNGTGRAFTTSSVTAIGSLTKSFTALAVMKLVEAGKLELDKPVVRYLSWFRTANKEVSDKITVRMLLNNTSGLYPSASLPSYDISEASMEKFVRSLSSIYLYNEPGSIYEYSNAGFITSGLLISRISGMSYASFLESKIFQPLNMLQTTTDPMRIGKLNVSTGHYYNIQSPVPAKREPGFESDEYAPAGSLLHSSAIDIGKYLIAITGNSQLIPPGFRKELWASYTSFPGLSKEDGGDGRPYSYGLGWMISNIEGRNIIHHGGSTGKTSSFTMIDTANKIAAVLLMNLDLTFIDKYRYSTEITILNNVMRIATGLSVSQFGKPVVKDPTLNNFELKETNMRNYEGEYQLKKGGDILVYFGVDMKILKNKDGKLEGIIYRGSQTVNRFMLDFVNESVALSRNIAMPGHLKFKVAPDGKVSGALFNNIEFIRKDNATTGKLIQLKSDKGSTQFTIPGKWRYKADEEGFTSSDEGNTTMLTGRIVLKGHTSFKEIIMTQFGASVLIDKESPFFSETVGPCLWRQQSFLLKNGSDIKQCIIVYTENANAGYWFMFTSPNQTFTNNMQQVLNPLLKSFRFQ